MLSILNETLGALLINGGKWLGGGALGYGMFKGLGYLDDKYISHDTEQGELAAQEMNDKINAIGNATLNNTEALDSINQKLDNNNSNWTLPLGIGLGSAALGGLGVSYFNRRKNLKSNFMGGPMPYV